MPAGKVKWFNPAMGYGFIQPDDGDKSIFISMSTVEAAGLSDLPGGQAVSYDVARVGANIVAENLKIVERRDD